MPLTFNIFSTDSVENTAQYRDLRFTTMAQIEEGGVLKQKPYVDAKGIPTVGLGMNIQPTGGSVETIFGKILRTGGNVGDQSIEDSYQARIRAITSYTYPEIPSDQKTRDKQSKELISKLDAIMAERAADSRITFTNKRPSFSFINDQEIRDVFETIAPTYEQKIEGWVVNIPDSTERVALFSLAYNQKDSKPLLGNGLSDGIVSGNRAEAWYQIRYVSNGDKLSGLAKRRYYESALFGLYDNPASISEEEAKSVFATLGEAKHKDKIESYDAKYRHVPTYKTVNGQKVKTGEKDMLEQANVDYHTDIVQSYDESIAPAFSLLSQMYAPGITVDKILVDNSANSLRTRPKSLTY